MRPEWLVETVTLLSYVVAHTLLGVKPKTGKRRKTDKDWSAAARIGISVHRKSLAAVPLLLPNSPRGNQFAVVRPRILELLSTRAIYRSKNTN